MSNRTPTEEDHSVIFRELNISACVEWTGFKDKWGYGRMFRNRKGWFAHRWAWAQKNGPIPEGMLVLHKCDNRACVNVDHLYLGTHLDNSRDCIERGRQVILRGSESRSAKVNEKDVKEMRSLKGVKTYKEIASLFGIKKSQVHNILSRRAWKHI